MIQKCQSEENLVKKFLVFITILSFLGLIDWGGYYYWQETPRYSLYQTGKALQNHDSLWRNPLRDSGRA